jgi:hypothetical protein
MRDPAFLFYGNNFYEGTRTMLPEERACYVDLLIYQHQHNYIPTDLRRVLMYCSGVSLETVTLVLKEKFLLSDKGYYNEVLLAVTENRKVFGEKQSTNGKIGQFYKKSKTILSEPDYFELKQLLSKNTNEISLKIIGEFLKIDTKLSFNLDQAKLIALLKHLKIKNKDIIKVENTSKVLYKDEIVLNTKWLNKISEKNNIDVYTTKNFIFLFDEKLKLELDDKKSLQDYASHFSRWLPIEINKLKNKPNGKQLTSKEQFSFSIADAKKTLARGN